MWKSVAGVICSLNCSLALMTVPMTIFTVVANCAPFWTSIITYFWLGESIGCYNMIAMVGSFCGVVIITLADPDETSTILNPMVEGWSTRATYTLGISASLIVSITYAIWVLLSRPLKDVDVSVIVFWDGFSNTTVTGVCLLGWLGLYLAGAKDNAPFTFTSNTAAYLDILGTALAVIPANMAMIVASQYENPALVTLLGYTHVVFCFLVDKFIFHSKFSSL